jgi:ankyrin repeat protein
MLELVKQCKWQDVAAALRENTGLLGLRDKRGRNWLHLCCGLDIEKRGLAADDTVKTAEVLLRAGLDINQEAFREGDWKATPLWYSIAFGKNLALTEYLLKHGSDPDHCLWAAAYNDDARAIRLLIENGANHPSSTDSSPFLFAIQWSRFAGAEELLNLGADVNFQDPKKMTALHYLLKKGSEIEQIEMLIKHGARGDLGNERGETAIDIMKRKRDPAFRQLAAEIARI